MMYLFLYREEGARLVREEKVFFADFTLSVLYNSLSLQKKSPFYGTIGLSEDVYFGGYFT